ncbi:MAG: DUF1080 domain-containing protein [Gammaproteobacteria bacterium]|nr:DUF1080 domain-containing protein [Gammaproteobacteria bacterium]MDH5303526.1 DUF1080 domain-containing protein [Gammaproteobacteria bacterium]MDH5321868.1 DUF1080 domain-containing protein [Gammaproteobacteria bacterium]
MRNPSGYIWVTTLISMVACAQESPTRGFASLFDGRTLQNWSVDDARYAANFSVRDGLLHVEGEGGWLRSARKYTDFTLRMEFRYLTEDPGRGRVGVSGIFLRTPADSSYDSGWPDNSLEVQLANRQGHRPAIPGDARWGGAVLRHGNPGGPTSFDTGTALQAYGPTGAWQTLEIQAIGDAVHVTLNDHYLGVASAGGSSEGYIGIQAETGGIEFRSIDINEGVEGLSSSGSNGFIPLFDGATLNGWRMENPAGAGFDVAGGAIVVRGRPSEGERGEQNCSGGLWTDKAYGDFTLRYQARFETNASVGGFFVRSPYPGSGPGWNQVETRAMEDKLLPWNGILMRGGEVQQGNTMFDYRAARLAYAATADWTEDWVNYEVQAKGSRITVWVNGFLLSQADDVAPLEGYFGIQCERETVEYRNIEIRENYP